MTAATPPFATVSPDHRTMDTVVLEIPGPPVPWAAKQTNPKSGNRFIPSRQVEATGRVIAAAKAQIDGGAEPFRVGEPLSLSVNFLVKRPKGHWGTGRNSRVLKPQFVDARPTGKPDLSNLLKLVEDGLTLGGLIPDDDQIVEFHDRPAKHYTSTPEEQPYTRVEIRRVGG
jgi:Holliday junction resolvase RusA-like endonuclease